MTGSSAKFRVGQLIHHKRFDYRGVIIDVDPQFLGSEEWYDVMAQSRPPKDKPWYRVLVHGNAYETYVAERNLDPDDSGEPVDHPLVESFFDGFRDGIYFVERSIN